MPVPRKRILFVDDEPAILAGLQNLLHKERTRWDMVFAGGAAEALSLCRATPFDVLVSDMRMPGMDGATLLAMVRDEFPRTIRIMLTGHVDEKTFDRVLPLLHQHLGKPCSANVLRPVLEHWLSWSRDAACL